MNRSQSIDVDMARGWILGFAKQMQVDPAVLIQAMAEVCGMAAVLLDEGAGWQPFDERMADFCAHARSVYQGAQGRFKVGSHGQPVLPAR